MTAFRLTYGLASKKGDLTKVNQDTVSALIWSNVSEIGEDNAGLFTVADGFGKEGKQASELVCQHLKDEVENYLSNCSNVTIDQKGEILSVLNAGIQKANRELFQDQAAHSDTTVTTALVLGEHLYIAHAGESRSYLITENETRVLTNVHRYSYQLLKHKYITAEEIERTTFKDIPYRGLGILETAELDLQVEPIVPNSWLLLCSKALVSRHWNDLRDDEVRPIISDNALQTAAEMLLELGSSYRGYPDATALIVKFTPQ